MVYFQTIGAPIDVGDRLDSKETIFDNQRQSVAELLSKKWKRPQQEIAKYLNFWVPKGGQTPGVISRELGVVVAWGLLEGIPGSPEKDLGLAWCF